MHCSTLTSAVNVGEPGKVAVTTVGVAIAVDNRVYRVSIAISASFGLCPLLGFDAKPDGVCCFLHSGKSG
jgi:hypothetical protein